MNFYLNSFQRNRNRNRLHIYSSGKEGIEPTALVLETNILPLNYSPIFFILILTVFGLLSINNFNLFNSIVDSIIISVL